MRFYLVISFHYEKVCFVLSRYSWLIIFIPISLSFYSSLTSSFFLLLTIRINLPMRFQLQLLYKEITTVVISIISILFTSLNMAIFVYELELEQYVLKCFYFSWCEHHLSFSNKWDPNTLARLLFHTNLYGKKIKQLHFQYMAGQSLHLSHQFIQLRQ